MQTYISILRGINVSGHRIIKMDALQQLYSDLGFTNIQTYIQSGNVVFQYTGSGQQELGKMISSGIMEKFGFEVPVILITLEELRQIITPNPFINDPAKDMACLHITFLSVKPDKDSFDKLKEGQYQLDEFILINKSIYLYCPEGYSKTKLTNGFFENKLKLTATTRNWKTTMALLQMAENLSNL